VSKAAIEALCATWAQELEPGRVRFESFDPGPMRTGLRLKGYPGEVRESQPLPDAAAEKIVALLRGAPVDA
jgi:NAD(P)-dependent dehydrogenase (short-subunit alcohol dehydrogenase family)